MSDLRAAIEAMADTLKMTRTLARSNSPEIADRARGMIATVERDLESLKKQADDLERSQGEHGRPTLE